MFEFFISKRYLLSKHNLNFITIISILSTLGITIGVAALVIVLSVFNGFGDIVKSILINFDPHLKIEIVSSVSTSELQQIESKLDSNDLITSYSKFAQGKAILLSDNNHEVINLKGLDEDNLELSWGPANKIVSGDFYFSKNNGLDKIVLGSQMAMRLSRFVGDTVLATSFGNLEQALLNLSLPSTKRFEVVGIFQTNNKEYDYNYVFTNLKSAQRLVGLKKNFSGYEIRLADIDNSEKLKFELKKNLDPNKFSISTWYDLHKDLYDVMQIERWSTYIILCLIIAIATFNILGSLTMSVIEKQKDIGILKSMGATEKSIKKIFMFEGILVGVIGTTSGLLIGLGVCFLQIEYNIYPLDPARYIIDNLPIKILLSDIIIIAASSLFLSILSATYPAKKAARIGIIDAIKWE